MSWSPSGRHFRSPGSSPETRRREHDEFPAGRHRQLDDDEFFRKSPTFPRRIFKWEESPSSANHRFGERPRMFKRVFKPNRRWEEEFDEEDLPHLRRFEREFDRFDKPSPSRKFDDRHFDDRRFDDKHFDDRKFDARDFDRKDEFDRSEGGKVHHIPIRVERRTEETKEGRRSPEGEDEDWTSPGVQRLKKAFETADDFLPKRFPTFPADSGLKKSRAFSSDTPWDPHLIHTLPTRRLHKASQSMDDSKHPVTPKYVSRSYSETHEDAAKPQQQRHSAAFRSHSDGHCPNQTSYVTKIDINMPSKKDAREQTSSSHSQNSYNQSRDSGNDDDSYSRDKHEGEQTEETDPHLRARSKKSSRMDSPSLQQIAVVMQNVEDLIVRIEGYSGTGRDKQYRFLDEMLTRCMIRLDGVDTEGREDVRNARRAAIRDVQACIDRLESKADQSERRHQQGAGSPQKTPVDDPPKDPLGDGPKMAIPLGPAIPLGDRSTTPIPLGDRSTTAIPLGDRSTTPIPLGDRSTAAIPLGDRSTKAIPLGDRSTTPIPLGDGSEKKSYSRQNSGNGEQTKL